MPLKHLGMPPHRWFAEISHECLHSHTAAKQGPEQLGFTKYKKSTEDATGLLLLRYRCCCTAGRGGCRSWAAKAGQAVYLDLCLICLRLRLRRLVLFFFHCRSKAHQTDEG